MKVVTLLSDFGLRDGYVAQMKGVILEKCPDAKIIDISHDVERHNIPMGSFLLETTAPYFEKGSLHVAVVDPGVGSERKPIVIECKSGIFLGPDNGLMARASERLGGGSIYWIKEEEFYRQPISNTFHGRDIFAHAAGLLAAGRRPEEVGPRISDFKKLNLSAPSFVGRTLKGQALHVDGFGNIITNIPESLAKNITRAFGEEITVRAGNLELQAIYAKSYYEVGLDEVAILVGSQGYIEIAIPEGNASKKLDLKPLDELEFRF